MRQYRITREDLGLSNSAEPDAVLDPNDPIYEMRTFAGLPGLRARIEQKISENASRIASNQGTYEVSSTQSPRTQMSAARDQDA